MADPWKRKEVIGNETLYVGDCLEILPTLPFGYGGSVITTSTFGSVGRISRQSPRYKVALPMTSLRFQGSAIQRPHELLRARQHVHVRLAWLVLRIKQRRVHIDDVENGTPREALRHRARDAT